MVDYFFFMISHIVGLLSMLMASAGLGWVFLKRFRFNSGVEATVFATALGLGLWALLFFCLGLLGLLYIGLIKSLTAVGGLGFVWLLVNRYKSRGVPLLKQWRTASVPRKLLVFLILLVGFSYWTLIFQLPQYPPAFWDATGYHLPLAKEFLAQHRIVPHPGVVFPVVLALNHMLFAWAFAIKDGVLTQNIEQVFMILVA